MKIYTKTGDRGQTGLFGGQRVSKADLQVRAYGAVDELNSTIGLVRVAELEPSCDELLQEIQSRLFDVGAELATVPGKDAGALKVGPEEARTLEEAIDRYEAELPPLKSFVLPGGTPAAAHLHLARTTCRRAERDVVALSEREASDVRSELVIYLNRLSDLLFVLARYENHRQGEPDVPWSGRRGD